MKISEKQKAILKSYARGVLVSFLTFLASNELGLDPALSVVIAALAGPAARALDASDSVYGIGADEK
jgi:hypothetical protein